ncbi:MAG: HDOD domain-containing protein [Rhodoferax sp.]
MKSFLQRLLPQIFGPPTAQTVSAAAPVPVNSPSPDTKTVAESPVTGPRRPLIASDGSIAGFEFRISDHILGRLGQRIEPHGRSAHVTALLTSARLLAKTGRTGLARVPIDWLAHAAAVEGAAGVWVGLEPATDLNQQSLLLPTVLQQAQQLRAAGAKVGWDPACAWDMAPDFALLQQGTEPMVKLLQQQKSWPAGLQDLPIVVTDVVDVEDLEMALYHGIHFACGTLAPAGSASAPQQLLPLPPEIHRVGHLLRELDNGSDTALIVSGIKSDVGLSYDLLKRINSASFAQIQAGASIDQAVLLLGRNALYRWLSLLLVRFAGRRKVSSALQEITLWRSRLLELLAQQNQEPAPDQLFTLGLASMLSLILKISPDDVVTTLNLPDPARQALLEQAGPWQAYLQIVWQVESHQLDDANDMVARLGGAAHITALADEAWAWAWAAEHENRQDGHRP